MDTGDFPGTADLGKRVRLSEICIVSVSDARADKFDYSPVCTDKEFFEGLVLGKSGGIP